MKTFISIILLIFTLANQVRSQEIDSELVSLLKGRIVELESQNFPDSTQVASMLSSMTGEGSWKVIDYGSVGVSPWPPMAHLSNYLLPLSKAYINPDSKWYKNGILLGKLMLSLDFWLNHNFTSANWWSNDIGVPNSLSIIMILLDGEIKYRQFLKGMNQMRGSNITQTGQNKAWRSGIQLRIGLVEFGWKESNVLGNAIDRINKSVETLKQEMVIKETEGIQPDQSFHQHGIQQQFGNYGLSFALTQANWIYILKGTRLEYPKEKVALLRSFIINGLSTVVWKGKMDISAMGRQLFPNSPSKRGESVVRLLYLMMKADPLFQQKYQDIARFNESKKSRQNPIVECKYYWRSAMMVSRTKGSYISTKMLSKKIQSTESGNGENLLGAYLSDGATFIYLSGDEYENIFPVWDWRRIPGVTSYSEKRVPEIKWEGLHNDNDFVGGVSDSIYGITSIFFEREGLQARKSNFFIDGNVVCLGAGISSSSYEEVSTTVNQSLLRSDVVIKEKEKRSFYDEHGEFCSEDIQWILHNDIGYFFLGRESVSGGASVHYGNWKRIHSNGSPEELRDSLFTLQVNHGNRPVNQSYSYMIIPCANENKLNKLAGEPTLRIIRNDSTIQAINSFSHDLKGIVFFEPGGIVYDDGVNVSVDQPCMVLITRSQAHLKITLATPPEMEKDINLYLNGRFSCSNCQYDPGGNTTKITFLSNDYLEAGKSRVIILRF